MGFARGSGFAPVFHGPKAVPGAKPSALNAVSGEASLAAHQAAQPVRNTFRAKQSTRRRDNLACGRNEVGKRRPKRPRRFSISRASEKRMSEVSERKRSPRPIKTTGFFERVIRTVREFLPHHVALHLFHCRELMLFGRVSLAKDHDTFSHRCRNTILKSKLLMLGLLMDGLSFRASGYDHPHAGKSIFRRVKLKGSVSI